jgi:dsDNA-binding SOS-regulon protein
MKTPHIVVLLNFAFFLNCVDKNTETPEDVSTPSALESKMVTTKDIARFEYKDYALSKDAQQSTTAWAKFQELATQITFLRKADVTFFSSEKDTLTLFLTRLKETLPEVLNTNPIQSRIVVLETRLLKFNTDLKLDNYSKEDKLESIKALLIANSNLIYALNNKLENDKNDVERPSYIERFQNNEAIEDIEIIK